jgi:hypothetical protein
MTVAYYPLDVWTLVTGAVFLVALVAVSYVTVKT